MCVCSYRLSSAGRPCFILVPLIGSCFVGLHFLQSASWPLSLLYYTIYNLSSSLFLFFQVKCAWTHFFAFMDCADESDCLPAAWSYMYTIISNLTLVLFVSL